jgi:hypothetical protein
MASVDTRLIELLARLTGRAKSHDWEPAAALVRQYQQRLEQDDQAQADQLLRDLTEVLAAGATEEQTWRDILLAMEGRRRLTETEVKTEDRLHQTFTVENALAFIHAIAPLCREFVPSDRQAEFVQRVRLMMLGASPAQTNGNVALHRDT